MTMRFTELKIPDVLRIDLDPSKDERGYFARTWDSEVFKKRELFSTVVQCSTSFNTKKGTLRGMHYQAKPHGEAKIVRCTRGSIYDVVVDVRTDSPTYKEWISIVLDSKEPTMLYIPEGCAHGFLTLENDTEILYVMNTPFHAEAARGIRFDDSAFGIEWPQRPTVISEKDRSYPNWV